MHGDQTGMPMVVDIHPWRGGADPTGEAPCAAHANPKFSPAGGRRSSSRRTSTGGVGRCARTFQGAMLPAMSRGSTSRGTPSHPDSPDSRALLAKRPSHLAPPHGASRPDNLCVSQVWTRHTLAIARYLTAQSTAPVSAEFRIEPQIWPYERFTPATGGYVERSAPVPRMRHEQTESTCVQEV